MKSKTIKINGIDLTSYFTPVGYNVEYKKIMGSNSGYMLDGSYTEDVLAWKTVITLPCMPLKEMSLGSLISSIYSKQYADVYFFDPYRNEYRDIVAIVEGINSRYRGVSITGDGYWSGMSIVLTEV